MGCVLQHTSPELQRNHKDIVLVAVKSNPDNIKYIPDDMKRDRDVLVASGMFDKSHENSNRRLQQPQPRFVNKIVGGFVTVLQQQAMKRKIVLSTRFALDPKTNHYEATKFTQMLKEDEYIQNGDFILYAPNAFDKKSCDPNWTDIKHPCRGTKGSCRYDNILTKDGYPTNDCCWRYSFRNQLEEAKKTGGFILQLVEREHGSDHKTTPTLGNGQQIELDMSKQLRLKVFHIYIPRMGFSKRYVDTVVEAIQNWYDDNCQDMSECVLSRGYRNLVNYF